MTEEQEERLLKLSEATYRLVAGTEENDHSDGLCHRVSLIEREVGKYNLLYAKIVGMILVIGFAVTFAIDWIKSLFKKGA